MLKYVLLGLALAIAEPGCGEEGGKKKEFTPPATKEADKDGWEAYVDPPVLDEQSSRDLSPGTDSPEAAIVHFYASRIRGDEKYLEALPPREKWSDSLKRKIDQISKWTFKKAQIVARKKNGGASFYVKVYLEVEVDGKKDSGKDTATVEKIDGKWYVVRPPT